MQLLFEHLTVLIREHSLINFPTELLYLCSFVFHICNSPMYLCRPATFLGGKMPHLQGCFVLSESTVFPNAEISL